MEGKYKLRRITSTIFVFLLLALPTVAQSTISNESSALLEIVHSSCLIANCSEFYALRIYANGARMVESNTIERANSGSDAINSGFDNPFRCEICEEEDDD